MRSESTESAIVTLLSYQIYTPSMCFVGSLCEIKNCRECTRLWTERPWAALSLPNEDISEDEQGGATCVVER